MLTKTSQLGVFLACGSFDLFQYCARVKHMLLSRALQASPVATRAHVQCTTFCSYRLIPNAATKRMDPPPTHSTHSHTGNFLV